MQKEGKAINSNFFDNCLVISFLPRLEAHSYCIWIHLWWRIFPRLDTFHQTFVSRFDCVEFKREFLNLCHTLSTKTTMSTSTKHIISKYIDVYSLKLFPLVYQNQKFFQERKLKLCTFIALSLISIKHEVICIKWYPNNFRIS